MQTIFESAHFLTQALAEETANQHQRLVREREAAERRIGKMTESRMQTIHIIEQQAEQMKERIRNQIEDQILTERIRIDEINELLKAFEQPQVAEAAAP